MPSLSPVAPVLPGRVHRWSQLGPDVRTQGGKAVVQPLIAPADVAQAAYAADPFRTQGGHHQGGPAPQVGASHRRPMEAAPGDHGHPACQLDVRPHAGQLIHMAVPAVEHILHDHGGPCPPGQGRHQDGLGVGGKAGIGRSAHGSDAPHPARGGDGQPLPVGVEAAARLLQAAADGRQIRRVHPRQTQLPARRAHGA